MTQDIVGSLIERNKAASSKWQPMPTIEQLQQMSADQDMTIIVTCADPRADPAMYIGLQQGEVATIRNAGGRVTDDVLRSLELISTVLSVGTLIVIHHTDCGALHMSDDAVKATLSERFPDLAHTIEGKSWESFHDIGMQQSIVEDVNKLKNWKFRPEKCSVRGFLVDIQSGLLEEVVSS